MMRNNYGPPPNPKHAITFAVVSMAILILPLFWAPLSDQGITPLATTTPLTVSQVLTPRPADSPAAVASPALPATTQASATPAASPIPTLVQAGNAINATPAAAQASEVASSTPASTKLADDDNPGLGSQNPAPTRFHDPVTEFSGQLRRIVLSLLVTTLIIAFTLKKAQKHIPAMGGQKPGSFMNVLAREAISPTQSLALVQVGPKILLVGLSEQNMTTLSEFSEADLESLIPKPPEPEARTAKSMYGDVLRHYLSVVPGMGAKK